MVLIAAKVETNISQSAFSANLLDLIFSFRLDKLWIYRNLCESNHRNTLSIKFQILHVRQNKFKKCKQND